MAFSTTASIASQENLMSLVSAFAVARGWTEDNFSAGNTKMSLHKGNCYVHFHWGDTSALIATMGSSIQMYQSLGFTAAGTDSWAHPDDSQNGANSTANFHQERGIKFIGPGPYTSLSMHGHTDTDVIYCILEINPGNYRHFAFGNIVKAGSWTGGEFVAGHHWAADASFAYYTSPNSSVHSILLDGQASSTSTSPYYTSTRMNATMHLDGLPNQETENPHWAIVGNWEHLQSPLSTDGRDANQRAVIQGCVRNSMNLQGMGYLSPDLAKGYVPIIPMDLYYFDFNGTASEDMYYLGRMHNIGHIQMTGISPQQVVTVGGNDWVVYPGVRKSKTAIPGTAESWNMGIIYKK